MCERKRFNVVATITVFLAVLGVCGTARGKIIYVDTAAVGENSGSSWADAYNHLQDALADANIAENPIEIHIAQGLYTPDLGEGFTHGDNSAEFKLPKEVPAEQTITFIIGLPPKSKTVSQKNPIKSGAYNLHTWMFELLTNFLPWKVYYTARGYSYAFLLFVFPIIILLK